MTFLIAFAESLAVIGAIIPGSLTMTAVGMLIGSGAMPFLSTFVWAVTGAFLGDYLSYWLGLHFNERIAYVWPFKKYPHWLERGKDFFAKHGGKSVVIGRFFGPVRSAVPLIAGLMFMPKLRFICAALPSAALWSIVYITPGIIVGMMSLALPPAAATKFILIVLGIVAFSWIFFVLIHLFFKTIAILIDRGAAKFWSFLTQGRRTHYFTTALSHPDHINPHRQLLLLLSSLLFIILFFWTFWFEITNTGLAKFNQPLYELLRTLRTNRMDDVMLAFTLLGDKHVMLLFAVVIAAWLLWRRYIWAAINWSAAVLLSAGLGEVLKTLYYSPRPGGLLNGQVTSSFPSGHTILTVTLFGFLAVLISEHAQPSLRKMSYFLASLTVFMVALSRLYFGAHWLTDVLASLFLGLAILCFVSLSYRHRVSRVISSGQLGLVAICATVLLWVGYGIVQFRTMADNYTLYWPVVTLDTETWWNNETHEIPYFIASRLGKPTEVINVQWLGSLDEIKKKLFSEGWESNALSMNIKSTLYRLSPKTNPNHLPLLPALFQNQAPILLLTKFDADNRPLHFMLWRSKVTLEDDHDQPLWLGSVYYYTSRPEKLVETPEEKQQIYREAVDQLTGSLKGFNWKHVKVSAEQWPPVMDSLNWDGRILLIKPAS